MTAAALERHALQLAERLGVTVRWWNGHARSFPTLRLVECPRIVDEVTYCRVLHELGHCATRDACRFGRDFTVGRSHINTAGEAAAWTWAHTNAFRWTSPMQAEKRRCLATYRPYAAHGSSDRIWRELDRIDGRLSIGHAKYLCEMAGRQSIATCRARLTAATKEKR